MNTLCGQNAELLDVKARGTYTYHWVQRVKRTKIHLNCRYHDFLNGKYPARLYPLKPSGSYMYHML
jgi:hypothetical protein